MSSPEDEDSAESGRVAAFRQTDIRDLSSPSAGPRCVRLIHRAGIGTRSSADRDRVRA